MVRAPGGAEPSRSRIASVSGAVLSGGVSSRMGRDKANEPIAGAPAAARVARLLAGLFEEVLLVGGDPPATAPGRRVPDPAGPRCALRGLVGALEAAGADRVLVVATDLPLLTPALLLALVAWPEADAVVPRTGDGIHPLCALYRREAVLPVARSRLAAGELRLEDLLSAVGAAFLGGADLAAVDPEGAALTNVNTPEDLSHAEALISAGSRSGGS